MSLEQERYQAQEAKALLENPLFKAAFERVGWYVDAKALACDPDNKEMAQRIILSKQLLAAVRREVERIVENGKVADIRIAELEKRNRFSVFRR